MTTPKHYRIDATFKDARGRDLFRQTPMWQGSAAGAREALADAHDTLKDLVEQDERVDRMSIHVIGPEPMDGFTTNEFAEDYRIGHGASAVMSGGLTGEIDADELTDEQREEAQRAWASRSASIMGGAVADRLNADPESLDGFFDGCSSDAVSVPVPTEGTGVGAPGGSEVDDEEDEFRRVVQRNGGAVHGLAPGKSRARPITDSGRASSSSTAGTDAASSSADASAPSTSPSPSTRPSSVAKPSTGDRPSTSRSNGSPPGTREPSTPCKASCPTAGAPGSPASSSRNTTTGAPSTSSPGPTWGNATRSNVLDDIRRAKDDMLSATGYGPEQIIVSRAQYERIKEEVEKHMFPGGQPIQSLDQVFGMGVSITDDPLDPPLSVVSPNRFYGRPSWAIGTPEFMETVLGRKLTNTQRDMLDLTQRSPTWQARHLGRWMPPTETESDNAD